MSRIVNSCHSRRRDSSTKMGSDALTSTELGDSLESSSPSDEENQRQAHQLIDPMVGNGITRESLSASHKSAGECSGFSECSTNFSSNHSRQMPLPTAPSPVVRTSYITHRHNMKRFTLDSTTSEFENDSVVQNQQRKMLLQLNLEQSSTRKRRSRWHHCFGSLPISLVSFFIFLIFTGAGIVVGLVTSSSQEDAVREEALSLSVETGRFFSEKLDKAILPLFSMAQFAVHLGIFNDLPEKIGAVGEPGALPLSNETWKRDIQGVCDEPTLVNTFVDIAESIKRQSGMEGILTNIQLAPSGVICLLHPMNNTEDFDEGQFMDNTPAWGLDLFHDPNMKYIALQSITQEQVGVAGPLQLKQCPDCDPFFIARLPIVDPRHHIVVDGVSYNRWGFATALIAWTALVEQSGVYKTFEANGYEFQLTRTDINLNTDTLDYEQTVVVLAETPRFSERFKWRTVSTSLQTTNNQWVMTVAYDPSSFQMTLGLIVGSCVLVAFFISILIYTVLTQKHMHSGMLAESSAQEAKVNTERDMTAYFAHELRNPLSALDSALSSITADDLPENTRELLDGMHLCSSFMSSIMNNLLDVRKIEEGKMRIRARPLSLRKLVEDAHKMNKSSVRPGVEFLLDIDLPPGRNWVSGDEHRIQQVLTNVVTNAIKYTLQGSITISVSWQGQFVQLECIDTGPGIPKSEQDRLFERFVQRGGAPGTGLGLNIALQIVNIMKGTICFESDPTIARGTTCRILLPLSLCEQPHDEMDEQQSQQAAVPMIEEPLQILIVDDIKMNRAMLSRRIQKAICPQATVSMAETGERALELCEEIPFDIIVQDQYMEEAGGVMLGTDTIIAMRRNKVNALIIGCSGNDLDAAFYEAGADMVWGKPMPSNSEIIGQWRDGMMMREIVRSSRRN